MYTKCHSPYIINAADNQHGVDIPANCGRCAYCTKRRIGEWAFRMMQELKVSQSAYFVTLTYDPRSLPYSKKGFKTLKKEDLQNFFKRLRYYHSKQGLYTDRIQSKIFDKQKIKYFACGEYGGKTKRPHYHAIIYNAHVQDIYKAWGEIPDEDGVMNPAGTIYIGTVNVATCRYVAKYIQKQNTKPYPWPWDGVPEYMVNSNGIGKSYLTPAIKKWHKKGYDRNYCTYPNGVKTSMPRYYRDKIWTTETEKNDMLHFISNKIEEDYHEKNEQYKREGTSYQQQQHHVKKHQKNILIVEKNKRHVI